MDFERILVAVNSPNGRDAAFARALNLARSAGAELYVLHAVPANQPFSFGAAERLERMADMRQRAEEAGVRVHTDEQHGDPAEIITLHANARAVDLIVIGGDTRRRWNRRGSVAERVVRSTKLPTLIVGGNVPDTTAPFRNVLVAVDLSPDSKELVRGALELTAHEPAHLTVMHTATGIEAADAVQSPARWTIPEFRTHVLQDARQRLQELASGAPATVETRVDVSTGSAARTIVERAADIDADLVVVGRSRGFRPLGSTAQRVLRRNERALLVIPSAVHHGARVERPLAA